MMMMMIYVLVIFFLIFRWWHRSGSWRSSRIYRKILLHLAVLVLLSFSPIRKVFFFFLFLFSFLLDLSPDFCGFCLEYKDWMVKFWAFFFYFCVWNLLIWEFDADFLKILCVCMFNNCLFLWIWFLGLWFSYFSLTWIFVVIFIFIFLFLFS